MNDAWDAIIVGAGVGGLSVGALLAKQGYKTLIIEKDDRVGGRALTLRGEEVSDKGAEWYEQLLAGQYTYLAAASPSIKEISDGRMLDGYTLDLGYHALSCAGEGYFAVMQELLGGFGQHPLVITPCNCATWFDGMFMLDAPVLSLDFDPRVLADMEKHGLNFMDFFGDLAGITPEQLEELDKVSVQEHMEKIGFTKSDILYAIMKCSCTLATTINNPNDISIGDIIRYFSQVLLPLIIMKGKPGYPAGFSERGSAAWPECVAKRFEEFGGETRFDTSLKGIEIEDGRVVGVTTESGGKEVSFKAPVVVYNPPVQDLFKYAADSHFPPDFVSRVKSLYGYGSITPYFGLNDLVIPGEHAERLVKTPCVVKKEEGFDWDIYMAWNVQSYLDPTCAPAGKHLLTAYLPVTEQESLDPVKVKKIIDAVPDFFESVYPGFKESVDWELYPVCWKLEGVAKSVSQAGSLKPDVKAPGVEGLYFAGDTVRSYGVGMDGACSSGILCASAITGEDFGVH